MKFSGFTIIQLLQFLFSENQSDTEKVKIIPLHPNGLSKNTFSKNAGKSREAFTNPYQYEKKQSLQASTTLSKQQ